MNAHSHRVGRVGWLAVVVPAAIGVFAGSGLSGHHLLAQERVVEALRKELAANKEAFEESRKENAKLKQMMGYQATTSFADIEKAFEKDMEAYKRTLPADRLDYRALLQWAKARMEDLDGRTEAFKKRDATSGAASSPRPNTASPREQSSAQRKRLMEDTAKLQKDAAGRVQKYEEENAKLRDLLDQTRKDAAGRSQKYEEQIAKLQARLAGQTPRAQPAGPQAPPTSGATVRTWSDATGQFRVEAELVEIKDATAVLKKSDGKLLQVPLSKLSNADREYVRQSQVGPKTREPARSETSRKE